jgi:hypothetical protein
MGRIITLSMALLMTIGGTGAVLSQVPAQPQEVGGTEAASGVGQHYRKTYDTYRGLAATALVKGDIPQAATLATKAYTGILDGTDVQFAPTRSGVVAAVNGGPIIQLTVPQFKAWLMDISGQYDHVREIGVQKALQSLSPVGYRVPFGATNEPQAPKPPDSRPLAGPDVANRFPDRYRPASTGYQSPRGPDLRIDPRLLEMARLIHPGSVSDQMKWIARQEQKNIANEINRTKDLIYPVR